MPIHPCFAPSTLRKLPVVLRGKAIDALQGSTQQLVFLAQAVAEDKLHASSKVLLAPVFYSALDPIGIPAMDTLDDTPAHALETMYTRSLVSLRAFGPILSVKDALPLTAVPDLWARIWAWLEFLDTAHPHLPLPPGLRVVYSSSVTFYFAAVDLLFQLLNLTRWTPAVQRSIPATPGYFLFLGHAWRAVADIPEQHGIPAFSAAAMVSMPRAGPNYLPELIRGAGGPAAFVAAAVAQWMHTCGITSPERTPNMPSIYIPAAMLVAGATTAMDRHDPALNAALLASETALPALILATTRITPAGDVSISSLLLTLLVAVLKDTRDVGRVRRALELGLLPAVVFAGIVSRQGARKRPDEAAEIDGNVTVFIEEILPRATAYASVISVLHQEIHKGMGPSKQPMEKFLPLKSHTTLWRALVVLVDERFELLQRYRAKEVPSLRLRGCDNLQCCRVAPKDEFKRCGRCRTALYCSPACQAADWADSHRTECVLASNERNASGVSRRDLAFLRALMRTAYDANRRRLAAQHVIAIDPPAPDRGPDDVAAPRGLGATAFDVSAGTMHVALLQTDSAPAGGPGDHWQLARVRRAAGRMEVHFLFLGVAAGPAGLVPIPFKTPAGSKAAALARLAREAPVPTDDTMGQETEMAAAALEAALEAEGRWEAYESALGLEAY
ncbi:MYND-type domain-containing protein [Mycena indigotica]|uniref:MYND-type domain-containing protein n=1 Tax=Mycena indigotica TaxID=2126181 RepID=A0A8H6SR64_9AGAR|nr:MYND-type domain-containing protein [Mycena indigotica]KAF7303540.1 MYND-type domain-containing protein [Mycena indigotica]